MATSPTDKVQRGHVYAIVDEVDSILIDEARTPLIISGRVADAAKLYYRFASVARSLKRDVDYEVDEEKRSVFPTEAGIERVEREIGVENLYDAVQQNLVHQLQAALRAKELYKRDKDYIIQNGEVKIVDEFTGRILEGRRWSEGLHQAVEAKEGVKIKEENQTLATITLQNYFRMYDKLAGMTGTATTESAELMNTYDLQVVPIPTNQPVVRDDGADLIYKSELGKFDAVVEDLAEPVRDRAAGARRHGERGQERVPGVAAGQAGHPARGPERQAAHAERPASSPRPAGWAPSRWRRTWPVVAWTSSSAGTRRAWPARRCCERVTTPRPWSRSSTSRRHWRRCPRSTRRRGGWRRLATLELLAAVQGRVRGRGRQGARARWALRARHGASREPPHRQPAAGPRRSPGGSRREPLLPEPGRRADAALRYRRAAVGDGQDPARRRADRGPDGDQGHRAGAEHRRAAQRRDPQERPQVRRGDERAAQGHLPPPGPDPGRRGPAHRGARVPGRRGADHDRGALRGRGAGGVGPRGPAGRAPDLLPVDGHGRAARRVPEHGRDAGDS